MKKRTLATIVATLMVATMLTACGDKPTDTTKTSAPTISASVEETTPTPEVTEEPTVTETPDVVETPTTDPADIGYDGTIITAESIYTGKIPTELFDYTYNGETRNILLDKYVTFSADSTNRTWRLISLDDINTTLNLLDKYFGEGNQINSACYIWNTTYQPDIELNVKYDTSFGKLIVSYGSAADLAAINIYASDDISTLVTDVDNLNITIDNVDYNIATNPYHADGVEYYYPFYAYVSYCHVQWGTLDSSTATCDDYVNYITSLLGEVENIDYPAGVIYTWKLADNLELNFYYEPGPDGDMYQIYTRLR